MDMDSEPTRSPLPPINSSLTSLYSAKGPAARPAPLPNGIHMPTATTAAGSALPSDPAAAQDHPQPRLLQPTHAVTPDALESAIQQAAAREASSAQQASAQQAFAHGPPASLPQVAPAMQLESQDAGATAARPLGPGLSPPSLVPSAPVISPVEHVTAPCTLPQGTVGPVPVPDALRQLGPLSQAPAASAQQQVPELPCGVLSGAAPLLHPAPLNGGAAATADRPTRLVTHAGDTGERSLQSCPPGETGGCGLSMLLLLMPAPVAAAAPCWKFKVLL